MLNSVGPTKRKLDRRGVGGDILGLTKKSTGGPLKRQATVTNQPITSLLGLRGHDDKVKNKNEFAIPAFKKKGSDSKPPAPKINTLIEVEEKPRERKDDDPFSIPPFSRKMKSDKDVQRSAEFTIGEEVNEPKKENERIPSFGLLPSIPRPETRNERPQDDPLAIPPFKSKSKKSIDEEP